MSTKVMNMLNAESTLKAAIIEAIQDSGLDEQAVKNVLNRIIEVIEENE